MSAETTPGVGLDIGTMNVVSARQKGNRAYFKRVRDAFIDLDIEAKRTLRLSKVSYVERDGQLIVIGDSALNMANLFKREARRPLSKGVIAPGELDAQQVLSLLVEHVLGEPAVEGEHCFYSVPAAPVDDLSQDVIYHTEIFRKIVGELGYTPHASNEAMAIIYSQCSDVNFSGLGLSFGAGMANVALSYQTVEGMSFSVSRGGDWVDTQAARAMGSTAARMCAIKEKGIDLSSATTREAEALALYVRSLIRYVLEHVATQFKAVRGTLDLPEPIPLVVSGGTSLAGGFMEVFNDEFEHVRKRFPIEISGVRHADDPMTAVASGLLVLAMEEHAE